MKFERELEIARLLALAAGDVLRRYQAAKGIAVGRQKASGEVVTIADLEIDDLILSRLAEEFPDDAVVSEQSPHHPRRHSAHRVWMVDAIDGVCSLLKHGDEHCVSIGLSVGSEAVLGVVYNPMRQELMAGADGCGAALNGARVHASTATTLAGGSVTVARQELPLFENLQRLATLTPLRSLAYRLARVAAGRDAGCVSVVPQEEWKSCAGIALIKAAGGVATGQDGSRLDYSCSAPARLGIVAGGARIHGELIHLVQRLPEVAAGTSANLSRRAV